MRPQRRVRGRLRPREDPLNRHGSLSWTERIANIRVLPDALVEAYGEVFGRRNQIEAFFSWLEGCFYRKDRHASWGRDAQVYDLIGSALLHNTQAWAHLTHRHPEQAAALKIELQALVRDRLEASSAAA